jgi:dTDP-4-dehydrorhamnose 3,5-epimerase
VRVIKGEILDVAVDVRKESPTCGQWLGVRLSAENRHQLYVAPGFAHGFCVLSAEAEIVYLVTEEYSPADEGGLSWNDPHLKIDWPVSDPIVSDRDQQWPPFAPIPNSIFGL